MAKLNLILIGAFVLTFAACKTETGEAAISDEERQISDSISKAAQKIKVDSMKKINPLLIMPPDSNFTGDYIDKYPGGITKFKGYFRFGQRHGQWMSFYPSGLLWSEMHYDKGLRSGPNIAYREDGTKRYEGRYKNDVRDSVWCYFDSVGNIAERVLFENDRIIKKIPIK